MSPATAAAAVLTAGIALGAVAGCGNPTGIPFRPESFDPIPRLHALDWSAVQPGGTWDYWELRMAGLSDPDSVIGSGGALTRDDLDPAVLAELDAARPPNGFSASCLPAYCYKYLVAVEGETIAVVRTRDELSAFLVPVEAREEAIVLVAAGDYLSWDDGEDTGVREYAGGWEVVVFELVRDCTPVQTDRVLYRVSPDGDVIELAREVWSVLENACV